MGLPRATYAAILRDVDLPVLCCMHAGLVAARYPGVSRDTVCSIFAQENQYKVIRSHHLHKAHMAAHCNRYLAGVDVLELCAAADFPPCLLMRRMLELLLRLSKQRVSDVLKQPSLLQGVDVAACLTAWQQQQQQQQQLGDTTAAANHQPQRLQPQALPSPVKQHPPPQQQQQYAVSSSRSSQALVLADPQALLTRLQADVVRCNHADRSYSPFCDMAKSLAGLEHEARLYACLDAAAIPYWSEAQLRARGLFKTPDALLQVPVALRGASGAWHLVHWIDSKASFGDDRTHRQQLEGQYATYVNRYGPGCVIYWFGFIADLAGSTAAAAGSTAAAAACGADSAAAQQRSDAAAAAGSSGVVSAADVHIRDSFPPPCDILQLPRLADDSSSSSSARSGRGDACSAQPPSNLPRAAAAAGSFSRLSPTGMQQPAAA